MCLAIGVREVSGVWGAKRGAVVPKAAEGAVEQAVSTAIGARDIEAGPAAIAVSRQRCGVYEEGYVDSGCEAFEHQPGIGNVARSTRGWLRRRSLAGRAERWEGLRRLFLLFGALGASEVLNTPLPLERLALFFERLVGCVFSNTTSRSPFSRVENFSATMVCEKPGSSSNRRPWGHELRALQA